jgi:hypothetical protein
MKINLISNSEELKLGIKYKIETNVENNKPYNENLLFFNKDYENLVFDEDEFLKLITTVYNAGKIGDRLEIEKIEKKEDYKYKEY